MVTHRPTMSRLLVTVTWLLVSSVYAQKEDSPGRLHEDTQDALRELEKTIMSELERLSSRVQELEDERNQCKNNHATGGHLQLQENPIAFTVGLTFDMETPTSQPIRVEYDLTLLNHGNAYDTVLHQFVAPVRGLYSFEVSMGPIDHCMVILVVDGERRVIASDDATCSMCYSGDSVSIMLQLEFGQAVWVEMENGDLHSGTHDPYFAGVPRNTFSGFLYADLL